MKSLHVHDSRIVDDHGATVLLRGVNLGGWLMMEGYILGGRNIPEHHFRKRLRKKQGTVSEKKFLTSFRQSFITKKDISIIKQHGFNCVRIPFHYRIITEDQGRGMVFLDRVLSWCEEIGIYAILDLHAAPGAQNADWHSDSSGRALFWERAHLRRMAASLWGKIARRYAGCSCIAGYDILNEPVTRYAATINAWYNQVIAVIRSTGDKRLIFVEGNRWAQEMDFLRITDRYNVVYSIHFYQPLDHAFNFHPGQVYPGIINGERWNKAKLIQNLKRYVKLQKKLRIPFYVGEFGINLRCYHCSHELKLLKDILSLFNRYGWHWTYWTYKAVSGGLFPNGIWQLHKEDHVWINRQGPETGWEMYPNRSRSVLLSIPGKLKTDNFVRHKKLAGLLRSFA